MKIRAPLRMLQKEAIRIKYPLLLRKEALKEQLQVGRMATHRWGPIQIVDEFEQVPFSREAVFSDIVTLEGFS